MVELSLPSCARANRFEKQSFENLVKYHEKALRKIIKGLPTSKNLSPSERRNLVRRGVLIRKGRGIYVQWKVSEQALDILNGKF